MIIENYVNILELKDLKINKIYEDLFFPYEILAVKDNESHAFSIETRDINKIPDCKIGNFYLNEWYRPKKAENENFDGYKTLGQFSNAVKRCLKSHGWTILGWIKK